MDSGGRATLENGEEFFLWERTEIEMCVIAHSRIRLRLHWRHG